jgi:hypothetical protein
LALSPFCIQFKLKGNSKIANSKIVFQKVKMEIDWENSDDVWKEYAAKKLAEE